MTLKVCAQPRCPALIPHDAYRGLCDQHRKQRDRDRGTRTERGYGSEHQTERRQWQARINAGEHITCWRPNCDTWITGTHWHLGHDDNDRSITRGPECIPCNLTAAGRASHR